MVVARAWINPAYKQRLLADGTAAAELGFSSAQGASIIVLENTARVPTWWSAPYVPVIHGPFGFAARLVGHSEATG